MLHTGDSSLFHLPHPVATIIVNELSFKDTQALLSLCRGRFATAQLRLACQDRQDPQRYLQRYFPESRRLLTAMATSRACLSGSRALEFFVPGFCSYSSDFNFYSASGPEDVLTMLRALEENEVVWEGEAESVFRQVESYARTGVVIPLPALRRLVEQCPASLRSKPAFATLCTAWELRHDTFTIDELSDLSTERRAVVRRTSSRRVPTRTYLRRSQEDDEFACYDDPVDGLGTRVVFGTMRLGHTFVTVRLAFSITSPHASSEQYVMRSWGSHLQCWIGGIAAVHLYPHTTYQRKFMCWRPIPQHVALYESRGFTLVPFTGFGRGGVERPIRCFNDSVTQVIHISPADVSLADMRYARTILEDLVWYEIHIPSYNRHFRQMEGTYEFEHGLRPQRIARSAGAAAARKVLETRFGVYIAGPNTPFEPNPFDG